MACAHCTEEATYQVMASYSYGGHEPVSIVLCCRDHLEAAMERLASAYPDHRVMPVRLPHDPDIDEAPNEA